MGIIKSDPVTKIKTKMHFSEHDDSYVLETQQDADEILAGNLASRNSYRGSWERHGEWGDLYARIPLGVWYDLKRQGIADDEAALRRWLDDRDNQVFRRRPGRLSK